MGTLDSRKSARDQGRFVGRAIELAQIQALFVDDPPASIVLVHGPAGIGKSTLLREITRRGAAAGWTPVLIEARDLPPVPGALELALEPARAYTRPLVLLDTYEMAAAQAGDLRQRLLPSLPEESIVVIAGRLAPEKAWFEGGWERLTLELPLSPLPGPEADELLRKHGVGGDRRAELIAWAGGSPLALELAASSDEWHPEASDDIVRPLLGRLAAGELDPVHQDALEVAAIARVTTPELIRDTLDSGDPEGAYRWLASRSFTDPLGDGIALHDLVRRALRADLNARDPAWAGELRRRIADHLHARAVAGRLILTIDLADLLQDPRLRWGYSWEGSSLYRIDSLRPGDADAMRVQVLEEGDKAWWEATRPFLELAPETVAIARDVDDKIAGYHISMTPASAPAFAIDDPLLGRWLEHARNESPDGNCVFWRDSVNLIRAPANDPRSRVQAIVNMAGILRSGLSNPRFGYLPIDPRKPDAVAFAESSGARKLEDLTVIVGSHEVHTYLIDFGPGGILGLQRDAVYYELGLQPPQGAPRGDRQEAVREALRNLGSPAKLARSELAIGKDADERAGSVRELLERAAERAFGDTADERLLHSILVRGYLEPAASHEQAAHELNVSRATYFRRLRTAVERLADFVAAPSSGRGERTQA